MRIVETPIFPVFSFFNCCQPSAEFERLRATSTQLRTTTWLIYCRIVRKERGSDENPGISATSRAGIGFQLCQVNFLFVAPEVLL